MRTLSTTSVSCMLMIRQEDLFDRALTKLLKIEEDNRLKAIKYYSKSTAAYRKAVKNYIHDELNFKEIAKRAGNRFFKWLGW